MSRELLGALPVIVMVVVMCICAVIAARKRAELLQQAEANAYTVEGWVERFGTISAYDSEVAYKVQLAGQAAVYCIDAGGLSTASHGALTKPGDFVTFEVLPGLPFVRKFYNTSTATA